MRHITLLDYGKVAMSNPLRQSLFTHEDSLNGGKLKAEAAAENLKRIFPGVVVAQNHLSTLNSCLCINRSSLSKFLSCLPNI